MSRKTNKALARRQAKAEQFRPQHAPVIEHLHELRRRLFIIAAFVAAGSIAAYALEQHVINALLRPSHGQHFIYTSPMGGINFLFGVCIDIGVAISLPIIIYHFLRFIQPIMRDTTARFVFIGSAVSGVIALGGIAFGYFIGLPAALHFLLHQFTNSQIQALITIQAYLSFVTAYLLGSALMFQLPLILIFINRIKPLKPSKMFHYERHIIVGAFVVGFIMNPTPNIIDQLIVVVPIILMYQAGIFIIWFINRHSNYDLFKQLLSEDALRQEERTARARNLQPVIGHHATVLKPGPARTVVAQVASKQNSELQPLPTPQTTAPTPRMIDVRTADPAS